MSAGGKNGNKKAKEFKLDAISLSGSELYDTETAEILEINTDMFRRWVKEY
jgi:hypothetical protein